MPEKPKVRLENRNGKFAPPWDADFRGGIVYSRFRRYLMVIACCLLLCEACGYHVGGGGDLLPPDVKTVAVPTFKNNSTTFRIEQQVAAAVRREFLERTHFRVTAQAEGADAILMGSIKEVRSGVITYDLKTGRATALQIQVTADVRLEDTRTHRILFSNPRYVFREEYELSEITPTLFEEDKPALERLSRDLARTLVTDILENF